MVKRFLKSQYFYRYELLLWCSFDFFSFAFCFTKSVFSSCLSTKLSKSLLLNNKLTARFKLCEQHLGTAESEGVWMDPSAVGQIQFRFEIQQHRRVGLAQLVRFLVVELTHPGLNHRFDMDVACTVL
jgi:hypothetical protein